MKPWRRLIRRQISLGLRKRSEQGEPGEWLLGEHAAVNKPKRRHSLQITNLYMSNSKGSCSEDLGEYKPCQELPSSHYGSSVLHDFGLGEHTATRCPKRRHPFWVWHIQLLDSFNFKSICVIFKLTVFSSWQLKWQLRYKYAITHDP